MLVERDEQIDVLRALLNDCIGGRGRVVLISGPVGSGKTETLLTFAQLAVQAGAMFLSASASRAERTIPLGALGQLFRDTPLPEETAARITRLLDDGALSAMLHERESEAVEQVTGAVLHELSANVLALAARTPLLIAIEEVQYADVASLQCLLYLVRRMQRARIMVVLTDAACVQRLRPLFYVELLSQPHCRQVRLQLLSPAGAERLIEAELGPDEAPKLAAEWHHITGGNPLLIAALLKDHAAAGRTDSSQPFVGDAFGHATLSCLHRGDPALSHIGRAVAVLDGSARVHLVAELLDADAESTALGIDALNEVGLLDDCEFRHPRATAAVLDAMTSEERTKLHERAAQVLHRHGSDAVTVASHLVAAGYSAPWVTPVLYEAARQALDNDDIGSALGCLRLAERLATERGTQILIKSARARVEWRLNPSTVTRHMCELVTAARAGELAGREVVALLDYLAWNGRVDMLTQLVGQLGDTLDAADIDTSSSWHVTRLRLSYLYPRLADRINGRRRVPERAPGMSTYKLHLQAAGAIDTVLNCGLTKDALGSAEYFLQQSRLDDASFGSITTLLTAMIFADRTERAMSWCERLLCEARKRRAPTWCATFSAIRSLISLRQGGLAAAEKHARWALSTVPPTGWGIFIGVPLSSLLDATMAMGQQDPAAACLHTPVPDAMFQTPFGVLYLHSRGHYDLEIGHPQPALADFEACRDLALELRHTTPGLAPWRSSMARALLALGQVEEARALAREELTKFGPLSARTRGIALRVLAMCEDLKQRQALLREAADLLQRSGDRLELAYALADLGNAQNALGDHHQARMTVRRAHYVAKQCGAEALRRKLIPEPNNDVKTPALRSADDHRITELSSAERRVATLAAQGRTNLQIARTLYVTVSTVEQHLTRAYRKLQVEGRSNLPLKLLYDLSDPE